MGNVFRSKPFPRTSPIDSPVHLWTLQRELFELAESTLGPRREWKIYQPSFDRDGPHVRATPSLDGGFAELGPSAERAWDLAVFQLAHETVHLLKGNIDKANYLEEGIAVEFSLRVQQFYGIDVQIYMTSYAKALRLVRNLPGDTLSAGKLIREHVGSLSSCSEQNLRDIYPDLDSVVRKALISKFVRD